MCYMCYMADDAGHVENAFRDSGSTHSATYSIQGIFGGNIRMRRLCDEKAGRCSLVQPFEFRIK